MWGLHKERMASFRHPRVWTFLLQLRDEMSWHTYKEFVFQLSSNACWWDQGWSETSALMTAYLGRYLFSPRDWRLLWAPVVQTSCHSQSHGYNLWDCCRWELSIHPGWGGEYKGSSLPEPVSSQGARKWKPVWTNYVWLFMFSRLLDQTNFYMSVHLEKQRTGRPPGVIFGATPSIHGPAWN